MSAIFDAQKKKVDVEQLYNSLHRKFNQLEIRCCRENPAPSRGGPQDPHLSSWSSDPQMSWREDAGMRTMSQRGWAPRSPVEQLRKTGKKRCCGHKSGCQYVAVLFGLQLPLTHNPFNKVRGIFFKRTVSARLHCVVMFLHAYVLCGYTTYDRPPYLLLLLPGDTTLKLLSWLYSLN